MRRVAALFACICLALPVEAESTRDLERGDALRLRVQGHTGRYVFETARSDTLYVKTRNSLETSGIPFDQVSRIDRRVPRSPGWGALRGMVIGGVFGGGVGAGYAVATWEKVDVECGTYDDICEDTATTLTNVARLFGSCAVFGMAGMAAGAIIGAAVPGSRWQRIDLPRGVGVSSGPGRSVSVYYTLRL